MTTRTTISIPDQLRAEMAPFDDVMNWSAIAADAFRVAIQQERKRRDVLSAACHAADLARRGRVRPGAAGQGRARSGSARRGKAGSG